MFKLLLCLLLGYSCADNVPNSHKPVIWSKYYFQERPVLFGLIRENETVVHLDPPLTAYDKDDRGTGQFICAYNIHRGGPRFRNVAFPFEIVVVDRLIGLAEVRVKNGTRLDVKKKVYYKFTLSARDCGSPALVSAKAHIVIKVVSAEDSVLFVRESYLAYVNDGQEPGTILSILPSDVQRIVSFNSTCDYEIITRNVPFRITSQGMLQNTESLHFLIQTEYFFAVVAKSCQGDSHSKPIFVKVVITRNSDVTSRAETPNAISGTSYDQQRALHDDNLLGETSGHAPSGTNLKMMMAILVITLCTMAVVVIMLMVVFRNCKWRLKSDDVYYTDDDADCLEWDNSTFDLLTPPPRRIYV